MAIRINRLSLSGNNIKYTIAPFDWNDLVQNLMTEAGAFLSDVMSKKIDNVGLYGNQAQADFFIVNGSLFAKCLNLRTKVEDLYWFDNSVRTWHASTHQEIEEISKEK